MKTTPPPPQLWRVNWAGTAFGMAVDGLTIKADSSIGREGVDWFYIEQRGAA